MGPKYKFGFEQLAQFEELKSQIH